MNIKSPYNYLLNLLLPVPSYELSLIHPEKLEFFAIDKSWLQIPNCSWMLNWLVLLVGVSGATLEQA
jgi:hypothetical protein